ncbi:saccharopine dehydrogenase [Palleronia rufa]|uniref:saccharopine dehydrogenase n=1 Tax=Palleronia rufa TaxID=1530186 RepID=UPI00056BF3E0|nr:saccharopine dehydrogenase [Palleronia rufa]
MTHLWIRAESRPNEARAGLTPDGVRDLCAAGFRVTVERSRQRALPHAPYLEAGAEDAAEGAWRDAPTPAIVFGLKELPDDGTPLRHRHIMFGHAYKGQQDGARLLRRFGAGGGALYDLEYLTGTDGRRVAAFGYWAGFAGAAVSVLAWGAQKAGGICPPVGVSASADALLAMVRHALDRDAVTRPDALVIGALGRVGHGARDLCDRLDVSVTGWDVAETAHGGPFPGILEHGLFLNCILAGPGTPVFVDDDAAARPRALGVIGDIACDPGSDFNPVRVYDRTTGWDAPVRRVRDAPPLDVMAIDNLPALLPVESSRDFAGQLLPHLLTLDRMDEGIWGRARETFEAHLPRD